MGIINHEAVLATIFDDDVVIVKEWIAERDAKEQTLFSFTNGWINGMVTVLLAPCGSKKGWNDDEEAERLRIDFIHFLETKRGMYSRWVEVSWGEYGQKILQGNNRD